MIINYLTNNKPLKFIFFNSNTDHNNSKGEFWTN